MLKRSFGSKDRVGKLTKLPKKSFREHVKQKLVESLEGQVLDAGNGSNPDKLASAIVTIVVGREQRLFAAHEDVLSRSAQLAAACRERFLGGNSDRRIFLYDEDPEIFSCVLEYLYKGDYSPRLVHDKRRNTWLFEGDSTESPKLGGPGRAGSQAIKPPAAIFHSGMGDVILRDTAVYCAAQRYGLDELKRLALRKQGLQSNIEIATILRSARYAYDHTPDSDSRLRAHYLALIIRSRKTFKRSGTMQMEMEMGGKLFFDLFVAMCNHMDDLENYNIKGTPRTI
jgi:hypothetical protein